MGTIPGCYVIGLFDCCRELWVAPDRSSGANGDDDGIAFDEDYENTILIFGCAPGKKVAAVSTVATEFVQQLQTAVQEDGSIVVPKEQFR